MQTLEKELKFEKTLLDEQLRLMFNDIIHIEKISTHIFKSFKISDLIRDIFLIDKEIFDIYDTVYNLFTNNIIKYNDKSLLLMDITNIRKVNSIIRVMYHTLEEHEGSRPNSERINLKMLSKGYTEGMTFMFNVIINK